MMKKLLPYVIIVLLFAAAHYPEMSAEEDLEAHETFLNKVEKEAFNYFMQETNWITGFTRNATEKYAPASNSGTGFMLSALIIGVERGWIPRDEAYKKALLALRSAKELLKEFNGFNYHYFRDDNGERMWTSEVSCIDHALFLAGAITVGEYFKGTEVEKLADELFRRTDWQWFLNRENVLQMAWSLERGFFYRIDTFSEGILCYILAMGSTTHPIPKECWDAFLRPIGEYNDEKIVYVQDGSLFQYLFPLAWLDLREKHDKYMDYWQNAIKAVKANKRFCWDSAGQYETFNQGYWGLSASLGPDGYKAYGAKPGRNIYDGTVAPYAVAGSIPLVPEFAIHDYRHIYERGPDMMKQRGLMDRVPLGRDYSIKDGKEEDHGVIERVVKKYGLVDAFNLDRGWIAWDYLAIDQGLTLLMIENYRTGLIWKYFMRNKYVKRGMKMAGFQPGAQDYFSNLLYEPGNPGDTVRVQKVSREPELDADLKDWEAATKIELTSVGNKHVEITAGYIEDDRDLSGVFYLGWDDKYFYVAGEVTDNEVVRQEEKQRIFKDDCVELYFDTDKDGYYFNGNEYDYQFGIAPYTMDKKSEVWAWGYSNSRPKDARHRLRATKNGYIFEAAIPFSDINNFDPVKDTNIRFSVSIHDRDADDKQGKLTWSIDTTSQPGKIFFGTLILTE